MRVRSASMASARTTARSVVLVSIEGMGSWDGAAEAAGSVGVNARPMPTVLSAGTLTMDTS